ncbi:MAG TPA: hypothetical protein VNW51_01960, partial [Mucilaginibacter sp.]|nr:hypothetical protein [Mucilaginibacter sp.]
MSLVKHCLLTFSLSMLVLASCSSNSEKQSSSSVSPEKSKPLDIKALLAYDPKNRDRHIDEFIQNLHKTRGFNGNILVAKHGKIIYENAIGWADYLHR